jgi:hypothetical protein
MASADTKKEVKEAPESFSIRVPGLLDATEKEFTDSLPFDTAVALLPRVKDFVQQKSKKISALHRTIVS